MTNTLRIAVRKFGPFESAMRKQYADFQATTGCPLTLELVALDLPPLYDTLFTQRGLERGEWDVAFLVTDWLATAVENGALLDLTPFMAEQPVPDYPDGWSPALTEFQKFDNAIYGLPYHDGPECFVYREDWFSDPNEQRVFAERFGYPLAVPRDWGQFEDIARFFTRPAEDRYGTIFAAFPDGHNTVYDFCIHLWSRGGELFDAQGAIDLETPEAVAALDFYRRVVNDRELTPPGQENVDSVQSGELFAQGNIAMMVNWFGFAAFGEQPDSPIKGKVAVAPVPAGGEGRKAALSVYWLLGVGAGSQHANEAYAFIRHCCRPEMDKITTLEGGIGCRLSTWSDPEVNARIPFYHRLAELHESTRELPRSSDLTRLIAVIDAAVQRAIGTSDPSEEILREAQVAALAR